jgi:ubiquinone/menaquinone biosynthesis C-methylase UbiE
MIVPFWDQTWVMLPLMSEKRQGGGMDALYHDPDLAGFYDWDNPWSADFDWFLSLLTGAGSVLDLGCGTGIFTVAASSGAARVVGVDPAAAMLDIARSRLGDDRVLWVEAGVSGLDLGQRFDAVVMTGHAFQTLLTPTDRAACLATIARHLAPGGRFFLDSRNPEAREWEGWTPDATRERRAHPQLGQVERWNDAVWDESIGIVTYETHYLLAEGRHIMARSQIGFPSLPVLTQEIAAAGLSVDHWYGDAAGGPLRPGCPDFIPVGRLA